MAEVTVTPQLAISEAQAAALLPPIPAEETETPPLASVGLELQSDPQPQAVDIPLTAEEVVVTVVEKDTPLEPPPPEPPLAVEHATLAVKEKGAVAGAVPLSSLSQPLSAALEVPQESETPIVEKREVVEPEKSSRVEKKKAPESTPSFKEESNRLSDLKDFERKALEELKVSVQEALNNRLFGSASPSETAGSPEEVFIWGVPLMEDERSDVILLKFLRARDFKAKESFTMLKNTVQWRRDFNVDELLKEDLGDDLEKVVFMHGHDKEGHPVCYNVYGEFRDKNLYAQTFSDEEKRMRFLRWRIQFLERSIRKLDFSPGGINTIFQVSDLRNSPGPGKRELRIATKQALQILQDNYPEFVTKQVFINVPWWHLAFYMIISPFLTPRTKSKFVFSGPARTAEMLFKYISPEQVPTQYGGLSVDFCECNPEFSVDDPAAEIVIKPATKKTVEIIVNEKCTLVWELRVVGWEVSYSAEYVPKDEHGYTVIIQKTRRMAPTDATVVSNSFNISELGKILLTIDNPTAKKKKLLYRFKVVPYNMH